MARTAVVSERGVEVLELDGLGIGAETTAHSLLADRPTFAIPSEYRTGKDRHGHEWLLAETLAATSILRDKLSYWNRLFVDDRS